MTKLSISRAWSETIGTVKRDGRLIIPVALAFWVIPATLFALAVPPVPVGQMPEAGGWSLLYPLLFLASLIGQLAIVRMAIGPAASVGDAIRDALRRALSVIGALLIFAIPAAIILFPIVSPILANPTNPPPIMALLLLLASVVLLCLWVRLMLINPVGVAEAIGPVAIVKRSWTLTRGNFWRLLATLLLFGIAAWIAIKAAEWVSGSVLIVALGKPEPWSVSALLIALIAAIIQAIASALLAVLLARIYVQLAGAQTKGS